MLIFLRLADLAMLVALLIGALMVYHGVVATLRREYRYDKDVETASLISNLANLAMGAGLLALVSWYFGSGRAMLIGSP